MRWMRQPSVTSTPWRRESTPLPPVLCSLTSLAPQSDELLSVGIDLVQYSNQPDAVAGSIREFVRTLAEAIVIVLAVSLVSLGLRTGLVVAVSIPLVLAATDPVAALAHGALTAASNRRGTGGGEGGVVAVGEAWDDGEGVKRDAALDDDDVVTAFVSRTDILRAVVSDPPLDLWS